jgi:hypothetical protein
MSFTFECFLSKFLQIGSQYPARQIVAPILQHTKVVRIKSYAHALQTLLLRILVLQNNSKFYMSNPCNCIQLYQTVIHFLL